MITSIAEAALRSLALALAVGLVVTVARVRDPRVEKSIWTTVLAGAIAMPALMQMSALRDWSLRLPVAGLRLPGIAIHGIHIDGAPHWRVIIAGIYTTVALVLFLRLSIGTCRLWRARTAAVRVRQEWAHGADIRVTPKLATPGTFGSTILLPENHTTWPDISRQAILDHERAHVRHFDSQIQWLAALHVCIFWFSPMAWWLRRRLAELAEQVSDDAVLGGRMDRGDYADVLLKVASARQRAPAILLSMAQGGVTKRIERILADDYKIRGPARWWCVLAVVSVMPVIALAADAVSGGATPAQGVASGEAMFGMSTSAPYIVESPSLEDLERWYPPAAARAGIDGDVQITVTLDEAGRPTDTLVLSETPLGMGFGSAASGLSHVFKYANPTGQRTVTFHVKFELKKPVDAR